MSKTEPFLLSLALALSMLLGACGTLSEPHARPLVPTPAAWAAPVAAVDAPPWPQRQWWTRLGAPALDRLIALAHANNHNLRAAAARVAQARARLQVESSNRYPVVSLATQAGRDKSPGERSRNHFSVAPLLSFEADLWGRRAQTLDALDAALAAGVFAHDGFRIALTSAVAAHYVEILYLNDRLRVAQDGLVNATRFLQLIEGQRAAGRLSQLEVERQRALVASAEAALRPPQLQRQLALDALATLVGRHVSELEAIEGSLRTLPYPAVGAGLPAALLERRPDIRRAEAELMAAHADLGAARAAVYPRLAFNAEGGVRAATLGGLVKSSNAFFGIGVELLTTIFDAGRRAGQVEIAQARKAELIDLYQQSVLIAFGEVEDALAGIRFLALQEQAQQLAAHSAAQAHRLAEARYRAGAADFSTVLDTQRSLLAAEAALDPLRYARFRSLLDLYRALGGGWEASTSSAM